MQVAAQGNQEIYLDLASFSLLKTPVRFCLNSNGKCILHLCKKEQINPIPHYRIGILFQFHMAKRRETAISLGRMRATKRRDITWHGNVILQMPTPCWKGHSWHVFLLAPPRQPVRAGSPADAASPGKCFASGRQRDTDPAREEETAFAVNSFFSITFEISLGEQVA